jgi:excisionase family DNA binding protein
MKTNREHGVSLKGERMLSVRETAQIMGWCLDSVRRKLRSGEMPGVRLGRNWRIPESQLAAFIGVGTIGTSFEETSDNSTGQGRPHSRAVSLLESASDTDANTEVIQALLRTGAARDQILKLVKTALNNSDVSPESSRRTLQELRSLMRAL